MCGVSEPVALGSWADRVDRVCSHIHANLDGDLRLEALAAVAQASPFHFHRIFTAVVGESPGALVRRARVERAARLMVASPAQRLSDIAIQSGFSELSDLSRSFRAHYGCSPTDWRHGRPPPLTAATSATIVDRSADTTVTEIPSLRLLTVRTVGIIGIDDLRPGYESLLEAARQVGVEPDGQQLVGMSWDNHETTPRDKVTYDFGLTVPENTEPPPGCSIRDLPASSAVAVRCIGPLTSVAEAWDHLYHRWFPQCDAEPADHPAMKWFHRRPDQLAWQTWDLDCVIALKR